MAGLMHVVLGGFILLLTGFLALQIADVSPAEREEMASGAQGFIPGGTVFLTVTDNGTDVPARISVYHADTFAREVETNGTTPVDLDWAAARLQVVAEGHSANVTVFVLDGQSLNVTLDLAATPPPAWLGMDAVFDFLRVLVYAVLAIGALLTASGIAAMMVRGYGLAIGGPLPAVVLSGLLAVTLLNPGTFLVFAMFLVSITLLVRGRRVFP